MRYITIPLLAAIASLLSSSPAYTDSGDQLFKLMPDDGEALDYFGKSVAISGITAIVGADWDAENGTSAGSAYLFDTTTGFQIFKLLANDGAVSDYFGCSVSISGTTAIVGAYWDDDNGPNSGSAYLFDTTTGQQIAKLLPDDGAMGDIFGISVAITSTTAIVGAIGDNDNGDNSGSAYLFNISNPAKPTQIAKLLPNDGAANDHFGSSVSISETTAIVGAYLNDDNGLNSGSAYLFDTNTGQQIFKLLPNDGTSGDYFGWSVAISGTTAIVGAHWDDDNGFSSGSAFLFDTTTGQQIFKILPNDGVGGDAFGISVAITGDIAIVGALGDQDNGLNSGSAYLFDLSDLLNIKQMVKILPNDGEANDQFSYSVSISETTAIIGAYGDDDQGYDSGSAYLFDTAGAPGKCIWDLDNSGDVGTADLLELFTQWSTDGPADFDESGVVGTSDLLILFANWGPCP